MVKTRRIAIALKIDQPFPIHQDTYAGVQRFAEECGHWQCVIDEEPWQEMSGGAQRFDGIIARVRGSTQQPLHELGVPLINTRYGLDQPTVSGVYIDAEQCGELAADHLIDRGFQRLAYMVDPDHLEADAICRALARQAEERVRTCTKGYIDFGTRQMSAYWQAAKNGIKPILKSLTPPVGILFANAWTARLAVTLAADLGWHVPQDVALVSIENLTTILEHRPQITSIGLNYEQIGYEAAAMLDRMMSGEQTEPQQIYVPPKGIITRASTDYFAVEDQVVADALRYISKNLRQPLTIERLADHLAVSARSLQRRFESALNRPVSDEIRRLRFEAAKRLLKDDELSIQQVARQVGFNSRLTINHVFHRELSMSPSEYRKRLKAEGS